MAAPIQGAINAGGGATTLAFGSNVTSGNALVVMVWSDTQPSGVTDTRGNTYSIVSGHGVGSGVYGSYWLAAGGSSGANTVTVAGGTYIHRITVAELSGAYTASTGTPSVVTATGGDVAWNSGNITPSANNAMLIGTVEDVSGNATDTTPGGSFTQLAGAAQGDISYFEQSTAAAIGYTGTLVGSGVFWCAAVAAFIPSGGGGGGSVPVFLHHLRQQGIA